MPYRVLFLFSILISLVGSPALAKIKVPEPLEELQNSEFCKKANMELEDPNLFSFLHPENIEIIQDYRNALRISCEYGMMRMRLFRGSEHIPRILKRHIEQLHVKNKDALPFIQETLPKVLLYLPGIEYKVYMKPFPRIVAWRSEKDFLFLNRFSEVDHEARIKIEAAFRDIYGLRGDYFIGFNSGCLFLEYFGSDAAIALYQNPENYSDIRSTLKSGLEEISLLLVQCHSKLIQVCDVPVDEARRKLLSIYHFIQENPKVLRKKRKYFQLMKRVEKEELKIVPAPPYKDTTQRSKSCS